MSTKLLHIILFVLLSVVVITDRYTQHRKKHDAESEYAYRQAKAAADAAVIAAEQGTAVDSHRVMLQTESQSKYAPPPRYDTFSNDDLRSRDEQEFPPDPPDGANVKLFEAPQGQVYDCQGKGVDLSPDGGEFTLIGNCPFVRVIGPNLRVKIQNAGVLKVYGPESFVEVERVNFINVTAPEAHVVYGSSLNSTGKVVTQVIGPNSSALRR